MGATSWKQTVANHTDQSQRTTSKTLLAFASQAILSAIRPTPRHVCRTHYELFSFRFPNHY